MSLLFAPRPPQNFKPCVLLMVNARPVASRPERPLTAYLGGMVNPKACAIHDMHTEYVCPDGSFWYTS